MKNCNFKYVTGSAKTCQDACIFENHFLAFYNSLAQGDYNALFHVCSLFRRETTSVAVPLLRGKKIGIIASEMKLPALQSKFRILNFMQVCVTALHNYLHTCVTTRYEGLQCTTDKWTVYGVI